MTARWLAAAACALGALGALGPARPAAATIAAPSATGALAWSARWAAAVAAPAPATVHGRARSAAATAEPSAAATGQPSSSSSSGLARGELPAGARPLAVHLRLELDPRAREFSGQVELELALERPTRSLWLHALALTVARAELRAGGAPALPLVARAGPRPDLLELVAARELPPGKVVVRLAYRGAVSEQERGVFARSLGGARYLFTQGQARHARRIAPCFDEPRWKVPWHVTLVTPAGDRALGNAPELTTRALPDGRREHRFAATAPMSSYLLAVAVGPFELVPLGALGRGGLPVRLVTPAGEAGRVGALRELAPRAVRAVEELLDEPLPGPKLDLVAVPSFFGGMENPGLVLLDAGHALVGVGAEPDASARAELAQLLVHELAHQWFGNAVTPATWRELWLSEGFATWVTAQPLVGLPELDPELSRVESWRQARVAELGRVRGLRRWPQPGSRSTEPGDDELDVLSDRLVYDKGASVLAMLAHWVGPPRFLAAVRAFVRAHRGRAVTAEQLALALRPLAAGAAAVVLGQADHLGAPRVRVVLHCREAPELEAVVEGAVGDSAGGAAGDAPLPVCVRYPTEAAPRVECRLVARRARWALASATCPRWLSANAELAGYYEVQLDLPADHPRKALPWPPPEQQTRAERLGVGAERLLALQLHHALRPALDYLFERLDPAAAAAPATREQLLERGLRELELLAAVDPLVPEDELALWREASSRLVAPIAAALPASDAEGAVERQVAALAPLTLLDARWPRAAVEHARARAAHEPGRRGAELWRLAQRDVRSGDGAAQTERLVRLLRSSSVAKAGAWVEALDAAPAGAVEHVLAALATAPVSSPTRALTWQRAQRALSVLLRRRSTRADTLRGLAAHTAALAALAADDRAGMVDAIVGACVDDERASLERVLTALAPTDEGVGAASVARALEALDRCRQWRLRDAGQVRAALARVGLAPR